MQETQHPTRPRRKFRPYPLYNAEAERKIRFRRKLLATVVAAALIAFGVSATYSYYHSFFEIPEFAQVRTNSSTLNAKVSGKVDRVFVEDTQVVKSGQLLVQIGAHEFEATLAQRQHELETLEARLEAARAGIKRIQDSPAGKEPVNPQLKWAHSNYGKLQSKVQPLRDRIAEAERDLKSTEVRAPNDGHIAQKNVAAGKVVTAGEPLLNIVAVGLPWTTATFSETQLAKIKVGQLAEITVPSLAHLFTGRVESILPDASAAGSKPNDNGLLERFVKPERHGVVKISYDASSLTGYETRLLSGASATVKVFVK